MGPGNPVSASALSPNLKSFGLPLLAWNKFPQQEFGASVSGPIKESKSLSRVIEVATLVDALFEGDASLSSFVVSYRLVSFSSRGWGWWKSGSSGIIGQSLMVSKKKRVQKYLVFTAPGMSYTLFKLKVTKSG